jgi:hypothetical protein
MTTTDTPKTAAEYDREWLTHYLPLPTVDDVAGPIVRAVLDLHNLVEVGEALPRLVLAEIVDREVVTEWISTVRQVIELVTVMAGRCTAGERERVEVERAMRLVVETITRWSDVVNDYTEPEILRLCYGTES